MAAASDIRHLVCNATLRDTVGVGIVTRRRANGPISVQVASSGSRAGKPCAKPAMPTRVKIS
ncbi:hypothetical protein [Sporisorium scitamineum]|uniref:Uncharacterized protein n=1 Tax=Sporisorium scitamineum TaxID=49012 RepID=A0A0F7S0R2_9BASI|nr:hypothetical protein [Sporisorium scitamineum]